MPLKDYNVDIPDTDLLASLELPTNWTKSHNEVCVYQAYRLTKGPGCDHRVCSCEL